MQQICCCSALVDVWSWIFTVFIEIAQKVWTVQLHTESSGKDKLGSVCQICGLHLSNCFEDFRNCHLDCADCTKNSGNLIVTRRLIAPDFCSEVRYTGIASTSTSRFVWGWRLGKTHIKNHIYVCANGMWLILRMECDWYWLYWQNCNIIYQVSDWKLIGMDIPPYK